MRPERMMISWDRQCSDAHVVRTRGGQRVHVRSQGTPVSPILRVTCFKYSNSRSYFAIGCSSVRLHFLHQHLLWYMWGRALLQYVNAKGCMQCALHGLQSHMN